MLSSSDFERLITAKKREIQREKFELGLTPPSQRESVTTDEKYIKNHEVPSTVSRKEVLKEQNENVQNIEEKTEEHLDEISPQIERYIRRYLGLPVMLKAGEYSPNNPLVRSSLPSDRDVFLGLGEYEQRSKTLRKLRQREYKELLDQQAKKKQEEKERAERERKEQEAKEHERERLQQEQENSGVSRFNRQYYGLREWDNNRNKRMLERDVCSKVDTGTQVNGWNRPLSIGVQTDESDLLESSRSDLSISRTQAERELSPKTVQHDDKPIHTYYKQQKNYDQYEEKPVSNMAREKLLSDLRHTYMPSIFDENTIKMRNFEAEQEAAKKRQFYQQDLKNQIEEQQKIKEERKAREKMLEEAELRRLEGQLKMLKLAQEKEVDRNHIITNAMNENAREFAKKRSELQKDIEMEQKSLFRPKVSYRPIPTSRSETFLQTEENTKKPFSTNIPENSIFSPKYDVDVYLRKNLNPSKESLKSIRFDNLYKNVITPVSSKSDFSSRNNFNSYAILEKKKAVKPSSYEPSFLKKDFNELIRNKIDDNPIPVLRHSPKLKDYKNSDVLNESNVDIGLNNSDEMKKVENKWKVPVVQKNILKTLPNSDGNVSILTQLGSIRRQLQLEQLKLDKMLEKK